jgi:hypothetical protein
MISPKKAQVCGIKFARIPAFLMEAQAAIIDVISSAHENAGFPTHACDNKSPPQLTVLCHGAQIQPSMMIKRIFSGGAVPGSDVQTAS